jgi:hypothetical protein
MADQVGRLLGPYQIAPLFVRLPSSDAPTLAPLLLTHHRQRVHLLAWYDSPGEARTGPIFKRRKIVNFIMSAYRTAAIKARIDRSKYVVMIHKLT